MCRDGTRLESWKAIARYLNRTVRTTQRWEKLEGLPVHRHRHGRQSTVFAYAEELEAWRKERAYRPLERRSWLRRPAVRYAAIASVVIAGMAYRWSLPPSDEPTRPDTTSARLPGTLPDAASTSEADPSVTNPYAYQQFMLGMRHLNRRNEQAAIAAFERATALDSEFVRPLGALALARAQQSGKVMDRITYAEVREAAEAALRADATLPEAHAALGVLALEEGRTADAESALRTASELDPGGVLARYWLTVALDEQGRYAEADAELNAALAIDPLHPEVNDALATRYSARGEYALARQRYIAMLELDAPPIDTFHGLIDLNREFGRLDEALHWARELSLRKPLYDGLGALIHTYASLEMYSEADRWREHLANAEPPAKPRLGIHCKYLYMRQRIEECYALKEAYLASSGLTMDKLPFAVQETFGGMAVLTGRYQEGISVLEPLFRPGLRVPERLGGSEMALMFAQYLAFAYQQTGRDNDAQALLEDIADYLDSLRMNNRSTRASIIVAEARNHALLGRPYQAIASLRQAAVLGWRDYVYERPHPAWSSLRDNAEFLALLAEVADDVAIQRRRLQAREPDREHETLVLETIERTRLAPPPETPSGTDG